MDYEVKLDIFEGPLDLLLYLIKKNELDIYNIPIALITKQYLEYIDILKTLNLDLAGEYLVLAATLVHIKSKLLLPEAPEEGEEEGDPRQELVQQLLEYQEFKDASQSLQAREVLERDVFIRGSAPVEAPPPGDDDNQAWQEIGLFELVDAFRKILGNLGQPELMEIDLDRTSLADRINEIMDQLQERQSLTFTELLKGKLSRRLIIYTFMALLELVKQRMIRICQAGPFGVIRLFLAVAVEEEHG
ncbi:MAG TPA: chromosome segregation protein ScpA [Syntrophus sp. (in: bacteria)]|jgi:segregation and condensation protein A|nr:chromosome segregation protein ScpA [Syntrophus sp. (in: bacteria)]